MLACLDRVIGSFFNDSLKILFDQASKKYTKYFTLYVYESNIEFFF